MLPHPSVFPCRLHIVGETLVDVNHCLMAAPGVAKEEIRRVISHPQVRLTRHPCKCIPAITIRSSSSTQSTLLFSAICSACTMRGRSTREVALTSDDLTT